MKIVLTKLFIILLLSSTYAEEKKQSISHAQEELQQLSSQLEQNKEELKKRQNEKKTALQHYGVITRDLRQTELKLQRAKSKLKKIRKKINLTKNNIREYEIETKGHQEKFSKRLVEIYKHQDMGWIAFLFDPNRYLEVEGADYFFEKVLNEDMQLIETMKKSQAKLVKEKKKLVKQQKDVSRLKSNISEDELLLTKKSKEKNRQIKNLSAEIEKIEKENKELEEASDRITYFIRGLDKKSVGYLGTGSYVKPVKGWMSSKFGRRKHPISRRWTKHNGVDFAAPKGYRIKAADSGRIIIAGEKRKYRGYGKVTLIDHGRRPKDGVRVATLYAHQSRILVKEGDFVQKGDEIGWVGSTGYSTGPHLHFEIRENGKPVDPLKHVKWW